VVSFSDVLLRLTRRGRAFRQPADPASHAALADRLVADLSARLGHACSLIDCHATRTGSLTCRIRADRMYVAKLPLRASTEPRLRLNAQALSGLHRAKWLTPFLAARLPAVVHLGTVSGHFYSVETAIPGRDGASILKEGGTAHQMVVAGAHYLSNLHKASAADARASAWEAPFESSVKDVRELAIRAGSADAYDRLIAHLKRRLAAQPIAPVYSHGNFWLGNVLFDSSGVLTGVIDWDCAGGAMLPALDLIYLLVRTHGLARSASFGEALADWIDVPSAPVLDRCIARHCRELSIDIDLIVTLAYCCWIQHLHSHCLFATTASANRHWLRRNVADVLLRWNPRADSAGRAASRWNSAE
jgi:aminoglycoside phosphotransferase (APT) family kinase protein